MRPATYEDLVAKAGHEVTKVGGLWRSGGSLIVIGSLILVAENALILFASFMLGYPTLQGLVGGGGAEGGGFPSGPDILVFLQRIDAATQIDQLGFFALGLGFLVWGAGTRGLEVKARSTGQAVKVPAGASAAIVVAGLCCLLWVVLSVTVRTGLTGNATGNWSGSVSGVFTAFGSNSGGELPPEYLQFVQAFQSVARLWIIATVFLPVGAIALWRGGKSIRRATSMKIGGGGFVAFSISAVVAVYLFVDGMEKLFAVVTAGSELGDVIEQVLLPIVLGTAAKLVIVPLVGIFAFLMLAGVGGRLLRVKRGRAFVTRREDKEIRRRLRSGTATVPVEPEGGRHHMAITEPDLGTPSGDVMVSVPGPTGKTEPERGDPGHGPAP
jgi:hypothetical protein